MSKTGGPAFPCDRIPMTDRVVCSDGISIRDYFAAKAMQRLFALDRERKLVVDADENARTAYEWADAMLKAREQ